MESSTYYDVTRSYLRDYVTNLANRFSPDENVRERIVQRSIYTLIINTPTEIDRIEKAIIRVVTRVGREELGVGSRGKFMARSSVALDHLILR